MTTLLRIDASSRHDGSWSRRLGDELAAHLKPSRTIHRDLTKMPTPHISVETIGAFFSDPTGYGAAEKKVTALSDDDNASSVIETDSRVLGLGTVRPSGVLFPGGAPSERALIAVFF